MVQPHLTDFARGDHQPRKDLAVTLLLGQQLKRDIVLFIAFLVSRDLVFARNHQPYRTRNIGGAHAKVARALAVDPHLKLGTVQADTSFNIQQSWYAAHPLSNLLRKLRGLLKIWTEDQRAHREISFASAESRRNDDLAAKVAILRGDLAYPGGNVEVCGLAVRNIDQTNVDVVVARQTLVDERVDEIDLGNLLDAIGYLQNLLRRAFDRGAFGPVHRHGELTLIVGTSK